MIEGENDSLTPVSVTSVLAALYSPAVVCSSKSRTIKLWFGVATSRRCTLDASDNAERNFGILEVRNGSLHSDYGLAVGLQNTHDRTYPAGLAFGSRVLVCSNLSFVHEVTLARRHTRYSHWSEITIQKPCVTRSEPLSFRRVPCKSQSDL
jgi:hypothetical protein